jgi:hypothetical protein
MPTKNFFPSSSLAPTHSSHYPFLYTIRKTPSPNSVTCTSLNCTILTHSPILNSSTSTSLNCNFAQTLHDMPSGLDGGLGHLGHWLVNMPSSCSDSSDPLSHLSHLSHLGYPSLLGHLGYLNILDPKPIDIPLYTFIQKEEDT